jgi:hypothetical protein
MPNTKAVGVAFSDPQFDSLTVTGATLLQATTATTVTASTNLVIASATVAATGSSNTDAATVAGGFTLVTAADATKGVILSAPVAGTVVIIKNVDVANAVLKVYPNSGAAINALTATTGAYSMAAKTSMILVAYSATQWYTLPLVAS